MKHLYFLLFLLLFSCSTKKTGTELLTGAQEVSHTAAHASTCDKCAASEFMEQDPDTAFSFSNGKKLLVCGYVEPLDGKRIFSEFVLSECGSDSLIGFWGAVESYEVEYVPDTFKLLKLEVLAIGDQFELVNEKWLTEYFYYEGEKLQRKKELNKEIRYSQNQIDQTLREYESTQWQTQITAPSEEYSERKMELANRLMISAASGSTKAEDYFKEFDSKFQPDGAYAEWYHQMKDLLEFAKKQKK